MERTGIKKGRWEGGSNVYKRQVILALRWLNPVGNERAESMEMIKNTLGVGRGTRDYAISERRRNLGRGKLRQ